MLASSFLTVMFTSPASGADQQVAWADELDQGEKLEALYEKAFGQGIGQVIEVIPLPTVVNGRLGEEVLTRFRFGEPQAFEMSGAFLLATLEGSLSDQANTDLAELAFHNDWVDAEVLARLGIVAVLDESRLEVVLTVPPRLLPTHVRNPDGLPKEAEGALGPAAISGYLTARARGRFAWHGDADDPPPREGHVDLESALSVHGVVIEGGADLDSTSTELIRRSYSRAIHDDQEHAIRYTAGDFIVPYTGFHDGLALVGFNVARNFALQPYSSYRPAGRFEFLLESRALVRIYLNDVLVDSLNLDAGAHDIRNFPLCQGSNDIRLVILEADGTLRELDFSTAVSADLLARGAHQFSYGLGFIPEAETAAYDWQNPTASLIHRIGVNDTMTLQAYSALNATDQIVGVGQALATRFGNVALDVGVGHTLGSDLLPGARLRYDVMKVEGTSTVVRELNLSVEYRPGELGRFTEFNDETPPMTTTAGFTQVLPGRTRVTLDAMHKFGGTVPWEEPTTRVQLGLHSNLLRQVSASVLGARLRTSGSPTEWRVGVAVSSNLRRTNQSLRGSVDASSLGSLSEVASWTHVTPGAGFGTQSGLVVAKTDETQSVSAHSELSTSRGILGVAHELSGQAWRVDPTSQVTEVSAASSIAFADGVWGLSSPIEGSFVVVGRRARMKGQLLEVNPTEERAAARADRLGAAVLPNLTAYSITPLTLDAPNLPIGSELGPDHFYLLPGYKTGTALVVGNQASILIQGVLLRPDGTPAAFITGQVVNLTEPSAAPAVVFTNGSGRFFVEGLEPGRHELVVLPGETSPFEFTLSQDMEGLQAMGTVTLASKRSIEGFEPSWHVGSQDATGPASEGSPVPPLLEQGLATLPPMPAPIDEVGSVLAEKQAAPVERGQADTRLPNVQGRRDGVSFIEVATAPWPLAIYDLGERTDTGVVGALTFYDATCGPYANDAVVTAWQAWQAVERGVEQMTLGEDQGSVSLSLWSVPSRDYLYVRCLHVDTLALGWWSDQLVKTTVHTQPNRFIVPGRTTISARTVIVLWPSLGGPTAGAASNNLVSPQPLDRTGATHACGCSCSTHRTRCRGSVRSLLALILLAGANSRRRRRWVVVQRQCCGPQITTHPPVALYRPASRTLP